jgi:acetylornithine deacetylase
MSAAPTTPPRERVLAAIDEAADELVAFVAETVRARSVTGAEGEVARLYEQWLSDRGFAVKLAPVDPAFRDARPAFAGERDLAARPNVYGWLQAPTGRPVLALNGHIDVVPAAGGDGDPFSGEVAGGRLRGRGAADMKGGLAAGMFAAHAVRAAGVELGCDV